MSAGLGFPFGIGMDKVGNLFVADSENRVVRRVDRTGIISTVAGIGGWQSGYSGDGGPATKARLSIPTAVSVDAGGNLYIADAWNEVIRRVDAASGIITTVVENGTACGLPSGDGGAANSTELCLPFGVLVDKAGNLWIADSSTNRVLEATATALPPKLATATPVFGLAGGSYGSAKTVAITDSTPGAAIYVAFGGISPSAAGTPYKGPIDVAGNVVIKAMAVAPGHLAGLDATAAYTITTPPASVISTVAGNGRPGFAGVGGPATQAQIGSVQAVAVDGGGNLYFTDALNNVVWKVLAKTGLATIVAGNGTGGYGGDGGPAVDAELHSPLGIAVDKAGNIYVADSSNERVRKVTAATGLITTYAGSGAQGSPGLPSGDGGPATNAALASPCGLVFDIAGDLYIADTFNNRVRKVSGVGGIISTVAGDGMRGAAGDGGLATSAAIDEPTTVAIDAAGNLYIGAMFSGRVQGNSENRLDFDGGRRWH